MRVKRPIKLVLVSLAVPALLSAWGGPVRAQVVSGLSNVRAVAPVHSSTSTGTAVAPSNASFPVKTLLEYGATGSAQVDDSVAIQSAINAVAAAGGGIINIPAGSYMHSATITRPRNVILQGAGLANTYFIYTGSTVAWTLGDTTTTGNLAAIHRGGFRDLTLFGPGYSGTVLGVLLGGDSANKMNASSTIDDNEVWRDVMVTNFGVGAKPGNNTYLGLFENVSFLNNGRHWVDTGGSNAGERMTFIGGEFVQAKSNTASAVELDNNLGDYYFDGISSDYNSNTQPDFACSTGTMHAAFHHAHFEKFHGPYFKVDTNLCVANLSIENSEFSTTGTGMTDPYMIGLISGWGGQVYLSVRDTQVNTNEPLTQFVDAANTNRVVTLDAVQWENYGHNLLSAVNNHGNPSGITIRNTNGVASVTGEAPTVSGVETASSFVVGASGGPSLTRVSAAPTGACVTGSMAMNTAGKAGSTLYVCVAAVWANVK